ncbi:MAG: NAD-dependent epimerase/dehydratase family protein [Sandaracinaceae bacterium]
MSGPILVTGAGGFIGARVAAGLSDRGHAVRRWDHRTPDLRDPAARATLVKGASAVVHCAAELEPDADPTAVHAINHLATVALAEDAARAGASHFVFLSSQAAIGWRADAGLVDESTTCAPSTVYGASKRAAEVALEAANLGTCRWTALRPPTVYAAEERRNFLLLAKGAALGLHPLPGGGHNRMSFCHAENLVEAVMHVLSVRLEGIVHVADERPVTLAHALRTLADAAGRPSFALPVPLSWTLAAASGIETVFERLGRTAPLSPARVGTVTADCALDVSRLSRSGWVPPVGFEEGVEETVRAYQADGLLPLSRPR